MIMAAAPFWKVYTAFGNYEAACKSPEIAAVVVSVLGDGATIRAGHTKIVWTEGADGHAGESYDAVADACCNAALRKEARATLSASKS
jgi:hypothetical protein